MKDGSVVSGHILSDAKGDFAATYRIDKVGAPLYDVSASDGVNTAKTTFTDSHPLEVTNNGYDGSNNGYTGNTVTISGTDSGAPDNTVVTIEITHSNFNHVDTVTASTTSGHYLTTYTLTSYTPDTYTFTASDSLGSGFSDTATFTVLPPASFIITDTDNSNSHTSGYIGNNINVGGIGFLPGNELNGQLYTRWNNSARDRRPRRLS